MKKNGTLKAGYTLVEMLTVVAIMGILAGVGVSGFQTAVQNARIKDAGINVTAYMEQVASEANRLDTTLCVVASNQTLKTYIGACDKTANADVLSQMSLESLNKFVTGKSCPDGVDLYSSGQAEFVPKFGLSAAPTGCFIVQYGGTDRYAAALKQENKNAMTYKLSYDGGSSWMD